MNRTCVLLLLSLAGCQPLTSPVVDTSERDAIAGLETRVTELTGAVTAVERSLAGSVGASALIANEMTEHSKALGRVETTLVDLPDMLEAACPPLPAATATECKSDGQRVPVSGDKIVVGVREHVIVNPPGAALIARIDTRAPTNTLYVSNIVEFQRDGDNWVRFNLQVPNETTPHEVERALRKPSKANAPVDGLLTVQLRVTLGDVADSHDFTLVDRQAKNYQIRLGRSFLRDTALVDVSRRFVQPRTTLKNPTP